MGVLLGETGSMVSVGGCAESVNCAINVRATMVWSASEVGGGVAPEGSSQPLINKNTRQDNMIKKATFLLILESVDLFLLAIEAFLYIQA